MSQQKEDRGKSDALAYDNPLFVAQTLLSDYGIL